MKQFAFFSMFLIAGYSGAANARFTLDDSMEPASVGAVTGGTNFYTLPYTITTPGTYIVGDTLTFSPSADGESAISIECDDVTLDLNGNTISQDPFDTHLNINGIYVVSGVKNIIIRNGNVSHVSGNAIAVDTAVCGVNIYNLNLVDAQNGAMSVGAGSQSIYCSNIETSCNVNPSGATYGFSFDTCSGVVVQNCAFGSVNATGGNADGAVFEDCSDVAISDCFVHSSESDGLRTSGLALLNCRSVSVQDSFSVGNISISGNSSSVCAGIVIDGCTDIYVVDCTASSNQAVYAAAGMYVNATTGCAIKNCIADANESSSDAAYGIYFIDGDANSCSDSTASKNSGATTAAGFAVGGSETGFIFNGLTADANSGSSVSYGLYAGGSTSMGLTKNGTFFGHVSGGNAYGIYDASGGVTTNRYYTNFVMNNTSNINFSSVNLPVYAGSLSGTPGAFENITL